MNKFYCISKENCFTSNLQYVSKINYEFQLLNVLDKFQIIFLN